MSERELMIAYFVTAPWQERHELHVHEILMQAAQMRAVDMSARDYFSHVSPEGQWPNGLVRELGYELPTSWPDDKNYIESIASGQLTSREALDAFAKSVTGHSPHAMGQGFFANHLYFGVGVTPTRYYVLITAPPEPEPVRHEIFVPHVRRMAA